MSHAYFPEVGLYLSRPPSGELMPISASDSFILGSDWDYSEGYYDFYGAYYTKYGTLFDPECMAKNPWIGTALYRRSIRRLWQRAGGIFDDDGQELFPPQLTKPQDITQEWWDFLAWNLDERLQRPFAQVIEAAQMAKIKHGRAVGEIMYLTEDTPFGRRVVIDDILDRDPRRFVINPKDMAKGVYRRSDMSRLPDKKFIVWTAKEKYEIKRGQSEFELLIDPDYALPKIEKYERRNLERFGSPLMNMEVSAVAGGAHKENWRQEQVNQLRKMGNQSAIITIMDKEKLNIHEGTGDTEGFEKAIVREIKKIGTVLLGNPTALIDGPNGSFSKEESTGARSLQHHEQTDAEDIQNGINYQLIPWLLDFNWPDVKVYPEVKIIPPETITPTTPKEQQTIQEIKDPEDDDDTTEETSGEESEDVEKMSAVVPKITLGMIRDIKQVLELQHEILSRTASVVNYPNTQQASMTLPVENEEDVDEKFTIGKMYVGDWQGTQNFQEDEEDEPTIPVAIPAGYKDFPRDTPTPESYKNVAEAAQAYLAENITAKPYQQVTSEEAPFVFTVKRFRNYSNPNIPQVLEELKQAIIPTLADDDEETAWKAYYDNAVVIMGKYGIDMDTGIRDDLNISFRQARQNAYAGGLLAFGMQDGAVGVRIKNLEDGHTIRFSHKEWHNKVLRLDDERLKIVMPPSDFGCVCYAELVYDEGEITPEEELSTIFPGESYRLYAQPEE